MKFVIPSGERLGIPMSSNTLTSVNTIWGFLPIVLLRSS